MYLICKQTLPLSLFGVLSVFLAVTSSQAQESRIVLLRDLTRITDNPVKEFDNDKITLADGTILGWERVLKASVEPERQEQFDDLVKTIGQQRFRLDQRIKNEDWEGALEIAELIFEKFCNGRLDLKGQYSFDVASATFLGRWQSGQREKSVLPFLLALQISETLTQDKQFDAMSRIKNTDGFANKIVPLWFDQTVAAEEFSRLTALMEKGVVKRSAAAHVYSISLGIAAKELNAASELIQSVSSLNSSNSVEIGEWSSFLVAYHDLQNGSTEKAQLLVNESGEPLETLDVAKRYLRGVALGKGGSASDLEELSSTEQSELSVAIIELVSIPALYEDRFPDISAAALFQAAKFAKTLRRERDVKILTNELISHFPTSYHAKLAERLGNN